MPKSTDLKGRSSTVTACRLHDFVHRKPLGFYRKTTTASK